MNAPTHLLVKWDQEPGKPDLFHARCGYASENKREFVDPTTSRKQWSCEPCAGTGAQGAIMDTQVLALIDQIEPNPFQPRDAEDPAVVAEIADSIRRNGLLQVPTARQVNGTYQLAFGHTRLAAYKHNGEPFMPLIVRELDDLQMFELGISENIKRRDLNPIEEARAMKRYMEEFGKSSVEAGAFFDVSPEKVRATVRLLNLPPDLQGGVADGTITQNNARRLLTIQRVAPDQIQDVASELDSETADPDTVIARALKETGNAVELWPNWRKDDEPLAGERLWPLRLPADQFPREHLPTMTVTQAARIVGGDWTSHHDKGVLENYIRWFREGDWPDGLLERINADGKYDRLAHLIDPPACTACPFYARVNGAHFCTLKECFNRKKYAWEAQRLDEAVESTGIPVYDAKKDGKCITLSSYRDAHKKLVKAKSPDLRLRKGNSFSSFNIPDGFVLVAIGKSAEMLLKQEQERTVPAAETNDESYYAEQRRLARMRDAHQAACYEFLWNVGTPVFAGLLGDVSNFPFLKEFADRVVRGVPAEAPNGKTPKKEKADFYRRALLFSLLDDVLDMWEVCQSKTPVAAMAKELQGIARTWGVKLPKTWLAQAGRADAEIRYDGNEEE